MDVGLVHGSAFDAAGLVSCWGEDGEGRLSLAGEAGIQVITASLFTCLLDEGGAVRCVGDDTYGQFRVPKGGLHLDRGGRSPRMRRGRRVHRRLFGPKRRS